MHVFRQVFTNATKVIVAGILLALFVIAWRFYLMEPCVSVWFHLVHGKSVVFQGRTMEMPLLWRLEGPDTNTELTLTRAVIWHAPGLGKMYSGTLRIYSPDPTRAGTLDVSSALLWQSSQVNALNQRRPNSRAVAQEIHSKALTLYCVESGAEVNVPDSFFCKPTGNDWLVFGGVAQLGFDRIRQQLGEEKRILQSIE